MAEGDGGVSEGRLLVRFADAVLGEDEIALRRARDALAAGLGSPGLVDAAGVVGLFNAIDRVADATGIPLDGTSLFPQRQAIDISATSSLRPMNCSHVN